MRASVRTQSERQSDREATKQIAYASIKNIVSYVKKFSEVAVLTCVKQSENILPSSVMAAI